MARAKLYSTWHRSATNTSTTQQKNIPRQVCSPVLNAIRQRPWRAATTKYNRSTASTLYTALSERRPSSSIWGIYMGKCIPGQGNTYHRRCSEARLFTPHVHTWARDTYHRRCSEARLFTYSRRGTGKPPIFEAMAVDPDPVDAIRPDSET